jgi:hypothetical protein
MECWCCEVSRGFERTEEEKDDLEERLRCMIGNKNPSYFLSMAESYFCMPGMFGLGWISFVRSIAWYWKKGGPWQWRRVSSWLK